MILQYINIYVFLISLAIGLFFVYILTPPKKVLFVYPTKFNQEHLQFRDKAHNCFNFEMNEVQCPLNNKNIKQIKAQI